MSSSKKYSLIITTLCAMLVLQGCGTATSTNTTDPIEGVEENIDLSNNGESSITPRSTSPSGWYMKTSVSVTDATDGVKYVHDTAGIFGELEESSDRKDKHDISAFGAAPVYVVFPQLEWDEDNGDYFSDYHTYYKQNMQKRVWTFQIKSTTQRDLFGKVIDLSDGSFMLSTQGPYDVYKKKQGNGFDEKNATINKITSELFLVDVDNDKVYSYAEVADITFRMEGKTTRTFRWVLGEAGGEDFIDLPLWATPLSKTTASISKVSAKNNSKFGTPPLP